MDRFIADFERRCKNKDFPSVLFTIYLQFSIFFLKKEKLTIDLMVYGCDVVFLNMTWMSRIALLEAVTKFKMPFENKFTVKTLVQILIDPYYDFSIGLQAEPMIALCQMVYDWCLENDAKIVSKVELW